MIMELGSNALSGNKGEWSEVYVLLKLLADGKMYAGDENLEKIAELDYVIRKILRDSHIYGYRDCSVVVSSDSGDEKVIPVSDFLSYSAKLLEEIKKGQSSFRIPEAEDFLEQIGCCSLKAPASEKADIRLLIHNPRSSRDLLFNYSIKSKLGSDFSLLNASKSTNFIYAIDGIDLSDEEIQSINAIQGSKKIINRYNAITSSGGRLRFIRPESDVLRDNLTIIDSALPEIIGELLITRESTGKTSMPELTRLLSKSNPAGFHNSTEIPYYEVKIKRLLTAFVVGMVPKKIWSARFYVDGGYLIVREDGEVLAYHLMELSTFEDLLFNFSYLERSSTGRHEYGTIYRDDTSGDLRLKLNLQIRMGLSRKRP